MNIDRTAPFEAGPAPPDGVKSSSSALPILGWAVALTLVTSMLVSIGVESALHFAGPPIDGPFQLYNALRRIAAGQRGGVDFQFFHGIGIPYFHYLPFRLFGGSFTASELTRQLITTLSGPLVLVALFRAFTRDWRRTLALSTIVLSLTVALGLWPIVIAVNSLLGLRAAFATLVPIVWVLPIRARVRAALVGAAIGGSILMGTEQGLAVLMAFLLVTAVLLVPSTDRRARMTEILIALGMTVVTIVVVVGSIGGVAGVKGAMFYNLKLVPMDQYWYFGSPPNAFITDWGNLWTLMADQPRIPESITLGILVFVVLIRRAWRAPTGDDGRRQAGLAILALYGLISCASLLGIFLVSYVQPCLRGVLIIGALELDRWVLLRQAENRTQNERNLISLGFIGVASIVAMVASEPAMVRTFAQSAPHIISRHVIAGEGMRLEGIWPSTIATGQTILDSRRSADGKSPVLWSTYAGLLEARNGLFHPTTDYIIHVLGPENRARYVSDFRSMRPSLVQTVLPSSTPYETWIEQTSWDFYAELIRNYRVIGGTPWSIFWAPLPAPGDPPRVFWSSTLVPSQRAVEIPMPAQAGPKPNAVLVEIEVTYHVRNPLGKLPIVGALPRYIVISTDAITRPPITLDPYTTTARFPIIATEAKRVRLDFVTYSLLPGAGIEVSAVRASQYRVTPSFFPWLYNLGSAGSPPPGAAR